MSNPRYYIHLQSKTMTPCNLLEQAYTEASETWLCTGCAHPKPNVARVEAHIQDDAPEGPLNGVFGCGVPLARLSFLQTLGEERIRRDLYLGDVFGPDGSRLDDWVTFRGKRGLIVRGTKYAGYRVCSDCGRTLYFAMHPRYLYPQPSIDVEIFESDLFGLVFPESVATEVGIGRRIRNVSVERLEVLQEPKDGLPPLSF